jgi:hypothetical protein
VWVLGSDPADETEQRRVCRVSKTNYRPPDHGLAFTIGNDERYECGYVTGLSTSAVTAEMLMAANQTDGERTEREETRDLLASMLEAGPMDTTEVLKSTRAAGISDTTVKRARRDLKVTSTARKDPATGKLLGWSLALPEPQGQPTITPQGQLLIDPLDPLVLNRTYRESRDPEDPQDQWGVDPLVFDGAPTPDDDLFLDDEGGLG